MNTNKLKVKEVPPKDYQVLLDDPAFKDLLRHHYTDWKTYDVDGEVWVCKEIHERINSVDIADVGEYCSPRPLTFCVRVHPDKPGHILIMIRKDRSRPRLTVKRITPAKATEGKATIAFSRLQKAIARNGGSLIGGAVAYEARRLSNLLN